MNPVSSYAVESGDETHQHLTNESAYIWNLIQYEVKNNLGNSLLVHNDDNSFSQSTDYIISGSAEEDYKRNPVRHFWDPDNPKSGKYNDGAFSFTSSYNQALKYFKEDIIPNYIKGNKQEAYYWLGRVSHLLQDASVPAHMSKDPHMGDCNQDNDDEALECYMRNNFNGYRGSTYSGNQYLYEALPNLNNFDWSQVEPKPSDYLFRLFWYTAQKTQYYASDDVDGNDNYRRIGSSTLLDFSNQGYNLWSGDGVTIVSSKSSLSDDDVNNAGTDLQNVASAVVPHAMKATAGLYRLFWDTVNSYSWPTYRHGNDRTGFTLLKGDMSSTNTKNDLNYILKPTSSDHFARPSIGDIDGDGNLDVVVTASTSDSNGYLYAVTKEKSSWSREGKVRELFNPVSVGGRVVAPPTLGDTDGDGELEIAFGLLNGDFKLVDDSGSLKWTYSVSAKYSPMLGNSIKGNLGYSAIADLDHDGNVEIIFTDAQHSVYDWPGHLYILRDGGSSAQFVTSISIGNKGGAYAAPSIANIDSDSNLEIIVPSFYGLRVFDYNSGSLTQKCSNSHGKLEGSVAVSDIDRDNQYELIYPSATYNCGGGNTCTDRINIVNPLTCNTDSSNGGFSTSTYVRNGVSIANMDTDNKPEVVVHERSKTLTGFGKLRCYDSSNNNLDCEYPSSSTWIKTMWVAPNVGDIDGSGKNNIAMAIDEKKVMITRDTNGQYYSYNLGGQLGSAPIIGDIDQDGVAELAVKRAGSPYAIYTIISAENKMPLVAPIDEVVAIAGEIIDLNSTGELKGFDPNGDNITFDFSSPLNVTGKWQTTINDSGEYSLFVEVSDSNLSDYQNVDLIVFPNSVSRQENLTDGSNSKLLTYSQAGNQTIQVKLPKRSNIVYSRIKVEGMAP
ncbi:FG-GAP-like repeat-containing protein [Nanoarchaeota archaeon]